ncbi:MAG TPA: histidine--tRNA ligase [Candidatus Bathyarchaeia archaeon]|nr:histidine--tRNA ligase [Candidatus Bathyarchaeia archaeon]
MINRVTGTQDFLDLSLYTYIITIAQHHLQTYHYTGIQTPILEPLELFVRSVGQHTDIVSKEMFLIDAHTTEERICLRPEITASIVRAFIENGIQITPWKVYTYGPVFRHERPQKGRFRQFHQLSAEVIGARSITEDVQFIVMFDRLFHEKYNLNNYALLINFLGCATDRATFKKELVAFLQKQTTLCANCIQRTNTNPLRVFDCKNPTCQELYRTAPVITDFLCTPCQDEWAQLQQNLLLLSVSYVHSPTLMRGLDYYSKTVFEFTSQNLGAQNAFCGGGRYDTLVSALGGKEDQPSIGAAIGLERLVMLLEPFASQLPLPQKPPLHCIIPLSLAQHPLALLLADEFHAKGLCTDILCEGSIKSMMRKANKMGASFVLLLGQTEQENKTVTIKNMQTGTEESVPQIEAIRYVSR